MRKLIIVSLLFLIPLICFCQTKNQLDEIKKRGLNINNLKTISGKLNLNEGDGYSYKTFKKGDYSNKKYLNEVYAFYAGKVYMRVKKSPITKLTSDRMNQFLMYVIANYDKELIIKWDKYEWTSEKVLIENPDLWEYITKF